MQTLLILVITLTLIILGRHIYLQEELLKAQTQQIQSLQKNLSHDEQTFKGNQSQVQNEMDRLNSLINTKKGQLQSINDQLDRLQNFNDKGQNEKIYQGDVKQQKDKINAINDQIKNLEGQKASGQTQQRYAKEQAQNNQQDTLNDLDVQIQTEQANLQQLNANAAAYKAQRNDYTAQVNYRNTLPQIAQEKATIEKLKATRKATAAGTSGQVSQAQAPWKEVEGRINQNIQDLKVQVQYEKGQLDQLTKNYNDVHKDYASLQDQIKNLTQQKKNLQGAITDLQSQVQALKK